MGDILAVLLGKAYKDGMSEKELEKITKEAWILSPTKVKNIKYIIGIKNKEIKSIYKVNGYRKEKKRYAFDVEKVDIKTEQEIKNVLDNQVSFVKPNPVRYLNSEDFEITIKDGYNNLGEGQRKK